VGSASGKDLLRLKGHKENVAAVCFDARGERVASGSGDDTLRVWDARTASPSTRSTPATSTT
jgi:WD40 repeat protein